MSPIVLTQLATGLSVLAGAVLVKSVMDQKPMAGPFPRCSSCNGTGRVSCLCSRWSDGDVGCRTCAGSGRMACSSCGGTGTGRPIPIQISARPPKRPSWGFYGGVLGGLVLPCVSIFPSSSEIVSVIYNLMVYILFIVGRYRDGRWLGCNHHIYELGIFIKLDGSIIYFFCAFICKLVHFAFNSFFSLHLYAFHSVAEILNQFIRNCSKIVAFGRISFIYFFFFVVVFLKRAY